MKSPSIWSSLLTTNTDVIAIYRQTFLKLAQNTPFEVVIDETLPAAMAMSTQDIKKPKLLLNPSMCEKQFGFTPEEYGLIFSHEYFHYYEESILRATPWGDAWYKNFLKEHIAKKEPYAKAYHTLYNYLRDIYVNWSTLKTFPTWDSHMQWLYVNKLFAWLDYTNLPKHLQYVYALLRESMVPGEKCDVAPDVRKQVDYQLIQDEQFGAKIQKAAWVGESLKKRLLYISEHIEPRFEHFLGKDIAEKEEWKPEDAWEDNNNAHDTPWDKSWKDWKKQYADWEQSAESPQLTNEGEDKTIPSDQGKYWEWDTHKQGDKNSPKNPSRDSSQQSPQSPLRDDDLYEQWQMPHTIENTLSPEDLQKFQEYIDQKANEEVQKKLDREMNPQQRRLRDKLAKMWLSPENSEYEKIKQQLERIDDLKLDDIVNPISGKNVMEEIEKLFKEIAWRRTREKLENRGPVDMEKGQRLHLPTISSWITEILMWKSNPTMFELDVKKEKPAIFVWEFDLHIICDMSSSMNDTVDGEPRKKQKHQQIAVMLILEAISRMHLSLQWDHLKRKLACHTQVKAFSGTNIAELKPYGTVYDDAEKLRVLTWLDHPSSSTWDYAAIADLADEHKRLGAKRKAEIKKWERKKIVLVMTDWQSNDSTELQKNIHELRSQWVIVIWMGITNDGVSVESNYASSWNNNLWYGILCPEVELLPVVLFEALKPYLQTL
jgi:hypothetical protein